jgi:oligosaccharide reducing-end xylanase
VEPELPTPTNPPNILVDVLELEPDTVTTRLSVLFRRLFISGKTDTELIYYENGDDAYVLDVLHDDTRMDAMGYGMLLTVQFDERELFARLWETVQSRFRYDSGPREGLYRFSCATDFSECRNAVDSFGSFYVVTALFLAAERWQEASHHQAALDVLAAMRNKEVDGEPVDGVLNLFTADGIPRLSPLVDSARSVSPVSLMPAFFELWYVRTKDVFWHQAAVNSRRLLLEIAHPETGLTPDRITETGELVEAPGLFREESYPAAFQLALDAAWFRKPAREHAEYARTVNRLLAFFSGQSQNNNYPALFQINGTVTEDKTSMALVALNGAAAAVATHPSRNTFLQRAWDTTGPSGLYRFYDGVYQLLSLSFLGGELRVTFE